MAECQGCSTIHLGEMPDPDHCEHCPPWLCTRCGALTHFNDPCGCWVMLDGLTLADMKAVLAAAGLDVQVVL